MLYNTDSLKADNKLEKVYSRETRTAYKYINRFVNGARCNKRKAWRSVDVARLARGVCILQVRGRGRMDQLGYADNFFRLMNDRNMVVEIDEKELAKGFQCKLFNFSIIDALFH